MKGILPKLKDVTITQTPTGTSFTQRWYYYTQDTPVSPEDCFLCCWLPITYMYNISTTQQCTVKCLIIIRVENKKMDEPLHELSQHTEELSALLKCSDNIHCVSLWGQIKEATYTSRKRDTALAVNSALSRYEKCNYQICKYTIAQ